MSHKKHKVCIRVPKVFDWVARQVDLPLISFNDEELDDLFDCIGATPTDDLCAFLNNFPGFTVQCRLRPDSLLCQEIRQPTGRHEISVTLPSKEVVELEKVKVLLKGLLDVDILDANGNVICRAEPIQFATAQVFFLCAPEGTEVDCHVTEFQCDADIVCTDDFQQLDISIVLCLDVQMEADVKLEIEAEYCKPRKELPISDILCPEDRFPPQCPLVFPGHH